MTSNLRMVPAWFFHQVEKEVRDVLKPVDDDYWSSGVGMNKYSRPEINITEEQQGRYSVVLVELAIWRDLGEKSITKIINRFSNWY